MDKNTINKYQKIRSEALWDFMGHEARRKYCRLRMENKGYRVENDREND